MVSDELKKLRIEGEFFDLKINPSTGAASYSFFFGEGVRLEVSKFRDATKLLSLLDRLEKIFMPNLYLMDCPNLILKLNVKSKISNFPVN